MPDGRTFIMGGLDESGNRRVKNEDLELFTPPRTARRAGPISLLGPEGVLGNAGMPPIGDYYPHLFWMPSGRGLVAGPYTNDSLVVRRARQPAPRLRWRTSDNVGRSRVWGTAVLRARRPGRLAPGGAARRLRPARPCASRPDALATNSGTLFDERGDAGWSGPAQPGREFALNEPRSHANTVLLPDGERWSRSAAARVGHRRRPDNGAPGQWAAQAVRSRSSCGTRDRSTWRLGPRAARVPHLPLDRRAAARRPRGLRRRRLQRALTATIATSRRTARRSTSRRTCSTATRSRRGRRCASPRRRSGPGRRSTSRPTRAKPAAVEGGADRAPARPRTPST